MASKQVHLDQAEHNEELSKELLPNEYYDWACTVGFYAAIHFVEAKFCDIPEVKHGEVAYNKYKESNKGAELSEHLVREILVKDQLPSIRLQYRNLMEVSRQARYLKSDKTACAQIPKALATRLIKTDLSKIKTELGF